MFGGPSQVDLFDYKPELQKRDGQSIDNEFRRNTMTKTVLQMNTGRIIQGHPSVGAWLSYGLGTPNRNLPAHVVMLDPRGGPTTGAPNWSSGYMPAAYQGTVLRSAGDPILNLHPPADLTRGMQRSQIDLIQSLNAEHLRDRPGHSELQARIASYELAFQLQATAPEALGIASESEATRTLSGINTPKGFTYWLAGGGIRGGISYGETDELGQQAARNPHHLRDLHATILHLMGVDPRRLTSFYGGLEYKRTGVIEPEVIRGILA